jgi:hypothetical protein
MSKPKLTAKEALERLKKVFTVFSEEGAAGDTVPADELKDYTSDTGAVYKIDKLEAGGKVLTAEGMPAPAGTITLADATVITVGEGGLISDVTAPTEPAPDAAPTPEAMQAMFAKFAETDNFKTFFDARFAAQEKKITDLEKGRAEDLKKYTAALEGVRDIMLQFADQPSDDPAQQPPDQPGSKETKQERIARLAAQLKALKENK